jgi:hypothetical protein
MRLSAAIAAVLLAGCTAFDPIDQRGETINRDATSYANDATLLNIIRGMMQEPLTFIAITGLDGTASASGTIGLPSLQFGPHGGMDRAYSFATNAVSRTNSNTFHISVVDDPASYAGLLSPINPAIIAFMLRQGYSTPFLFFLFTSELREVRVDPNSGNTTDVVRVYLNDPTSPDYADFIGKLASLLNEGLTAQVDVTAAPNGKALPPSRLCIDRFARRPSFGNRFTVRYKLPPAPAAKDPAVCEHAPWVEADIQASAAPAAGAPAASLSPVGVAADGSLWVANPGKGIFLRMAPDGHVIQAKLPPALSPDKPPATPPRPSHLVAYEFQDQEGRHYQLFPRSTYGLYAYIGAYLDAPIDNLLPPDNSNSGSLITLVTSRAAKDCFARTDYHGQTYCVPQNAGHSKQLFALLHLLQEIQTTPSNAPTTLTVTPVP